MKKLPYIEDYIELMAENDFLIWPPKPPLINLARYDVAIVNSMAEQVRNGLGFTDRQSVLAHKIVVKYRKQWNQHGYDVSTFIDNPVFKFPVRSIDRSKSVDICNGRIEIRFPYDQNLIAIIRAAVTDIPGSLVFDRVSRCWVTAIIEPRLIWAKEFGSAHGFQFGDAFNQAIERMLSQDDYSITLIQDQDNFSITNAADSLVDYIMNHGGFGKDNLTKLVDLSGVLGYQVNEAIYELLNLDPAGSLVQLLTQRATNLVYGNAQLDLTEAIAYARLTDRFPIYVYESGTSILRNQLTNFFNETDIVDRKLFPEKPVTGSVVYFNKWKSTEKNVPLLITTHTMMIGNRRQQMLQCADKIIYYSQCPTVNS